MCHSLKQWKCTSFRKSIYACCASVLDSVNTHRKGAHAWRWHMADHLATNHNSGSYVSSISEPTKLPSGDTGGWNLKFQHHQPLTKWLMLLLLTQTRLYIPQHQNHCAMSLPEYICKLTIHILCYQHVVGTHPTSEDPRTHSRLNNTVERKAGIRLCNLI